MMTLAEDDNSIAIVGMAGRFPGARNIEELWHLLKSGAQARVLLSDAELRNVGVTEELLQNPKYVKSCMKLQDPEYFDAKFFGYSPSQALSIDPQQRLFLEVAWEAIESAGYRSDCEDISVGVFGGAGFSSHLFDNLRRMLELDPTGFDQAVIDGDKDFLTSRVSYNLGLTGPSITVQTACSTSLVAIHLACRSLLDFECDLALAGGAGVSVPQEAGYLHVDGGIFSSDGYCRPFDADADGTVPGNGIAIVALRRLKDALASGDQIHAIIRSTAVNNDGARKVGYTAPGLHAQTQLLATALALADLRPHDIGLFEAHGTGTFLGDAIELEALHQVYHVPGLAQFCALGSIKANIGHLDAAAGVTGLIKAVLCLKNRFIVPMPNFSIPHRILAAPDSPFYVSTKLLPWDVSGGQRRRAAVSSFGMGGTNAHAILEEANERIDVPETVVDHIFPISARDPHTLQLASRNLAEFLQANRDLNLNDVAYTLQTGRRRFECRRTVVGDDNTAIAQILNTSTQGDEYINSESASRAVVFMFPGQGTEQRGMVAGLYRTDESFRQEMDYCADRVEKILSQDIRRVLCNNSEDSAVSDARDTLLVQPSLFVAEYCLARLLIRLGVQPSAVIGHSLGEYAAACIAGIISIEDGIQLVAKRAQLTNQLPAGAMLVASLSEERAKELKGAHLDIAAINLVDQCVLSGEINAVRDFALMLKERGIDHHWLQSTRAFHSRMVLPAAPSLHEAAARLAHYSPQVPFVSCVTGKRIVAGQIVGPSHWAEHLVHPVRFSSGLAELAQTPGSIFLEVGPGRALTGMARRQLEGEKGFSFMLCLGDMGSTVRRDLLKGIGKLWSNGAHIEWARFHEGRSPRRLSLPTYPFNRRLYALPRETSALAGSLVTPPANERAEPEQWLYLPSWKRSMHPHAFSACEGHAVWLVLTDAAGLGNALAKRLRVNGYRVILLQTADCYAELGEDSFSINPKSLGDYKRLVERLSARQDMVRYVVHCWGLYLSSEAGSNIGGSQTLDLGYFSVLFLVQELIRAQPDINAKLLLVANEMQEVYGNERIDPAKAALPALCKVLAQEYTNVRYAIVDIPFEPPFACQHEIFIDKLLAEAAHIGFDPVLAYRGNLRFIQSYERVNLLHSEKPVRALRDRGFYAITGGLGHIGRALARRLAQRHQARILLLTRVEPSDSSKMECIREIEQAGAKVLISNVDLCNPSAIRQVIENAEAEFGPLRGLFHLAADLKHRSIARRISDLDRTDLEAQLRPKAIGMQALVDALQGRKLDFGVAFSSNSAILGGIGFGAYAAANAILDSFVTSIGRASATPWLVLNWDGWLTDELDRDSSPPSQTSFDPYTLTMDEGLNTLWTVLAFCTVSQVIISTCPLEPRLDTWVRHSRTSKTAGLQPPVESMPSASYARDSRTAYIAPKTELECTIANIWQEVLGIEEVGLEDNFLDLGGDSLIGLRIVSHIRDILAVDVPLALLIGREATIATMVKEISIRTATLP